MNFSGFSAWLDIVVAPTLAGVVKWTAGVALEVFGVGPVILATMKTDQVNNL